MRKKYEILQNLDCLQLLGAIFANTCINRGEKVLHLKEGNMVNNIAEPK